MTAGFLRRKASWRVYPVADKSLVLVNQEGALVPEGESGELLVRSSYLAEGYWRRPEETAAAFQPAPDHPGQRIYRTGDRGRFLSDGSFVFEGRKDHQVKVRGYRVDTREVDSTLLLLDEVAEAVTDRGKPRRRTAARGVRGPETGVSVRSTVPAQASAASLPEWKTPARFLRSPLCRRR